MPHSSLGQLSPSEVQSCWNIAVPTKSHSYTFRTEPRNGKVYHDPPMDAAVYSGFHENNDKDMFFQKLELLPSLPKRKRSTIFRTDFQTNHIDASKPNSFSQLLKDVNARKENFMFELSSGFGKKLAEEWSAIKLDPLTVDSSVYKYERFCDGAFIGGSSKLQYFRSRSECQFPITYSTTKWEPTTCHTYCFTRSQKLERRLVLRTGLTRRSRILKRLCKPLYVSVCRLTTAEIRKHVSEKEALRLGLPGRECAVRVRRLSATECQNLLGGRQQNSTFSLTGKEIEIDGKVVIDLCSDDESDEVVVMPKRSVIAENSRLAVNGSSRTFRCNSLSPSPSALRDILTTPKNSTPAQSPSGASVSKLSGNHVPVYNGLDSSIIPTKRNGLHPGPHCRVRLQDFSSTPNDFSDAQVNTHRLVSSCERTDNLPYRSASSDSNQESSSEHVKKFSNGAANGSLSASAALGHDDAVGTNGVDVSYTSNLPDSCHKQALPSGACNDSPVQKIKNRIAGMLRLTESNNIPLPLPQKVINYLKTRFVALQSDELTILPLPPTNSPNNSTVVGNGTVDGRAVVPKFCDVLPKHVGAISSPPYNGQTVPFYPRLGSPVSRIPPEFSQLLSPSRKTSGSTQVSRSNCVEIDLAESTQIPNPVLSDNPYSVSAHSPMCGTNADTEVSAVTLEQQQVSSASVDCRQRLRSRDQQGNASERSPLDSNYTRACITRSMSTPMKRFERQSLDSANYQLGTSTRTITSQVHDVVTARHSREKRDLASLSRTPLNNGSPPAKCQSLTSGRLSKGSPMTPQVKIGFKCHICGYAKFFSHDSQSAVNDHIITKHGGFDKVTLVRNAKRPADCVLFNAFLTKNLSNLSKHRKLKS